MSRLRTSSPWTTPTTPLGARILREEPATVDAVPTMSLAEMEAALAAPAGGSTIGSVPGEGSHGPGGDRRAGGGRAPGGGRTGRRRWRAAVPQLAAVVAVVAAVAGCAGGIAMGAGHPSRLAPPSAAAGGSASEPTTGGSGGAGSGLGVAAAWGEATAGLAMSVVDTDGGGVALVAPDASVRPASFEGSDAAAADGNGASSASSAGRVGEIVGRSGPSPQ